MDNKIKAAIYSAIVKMLTPLVRILLRNKIPYGTFAELAKWVYVDVACREFSIPGKKQTTSRISVITGLNRKEVKRLRETEGPDDLGAAERYNRAARVISGWIRDYRYSDENGRPRDLPFEGDTSFSALVKSYSGDIPPRAVLDEMVNAGVVERKGDSISLRTRGYIVKGVDVDKIGILGSDVSDLISCIDHNMTCADDETFLQRKTVYDNIPLESLPELRFMLSKIGRDFIESADMIIASHDRDLNPSVRGTGRKRIGLGLYYIED
jgi:hypothetical protein